METPGSKDVPIRHLRADDFVIETNHLFRVAYSTAKFSRTGGICVERQVLDAPRKPCLKDLDRRRAAIAIYRVHGVIAIRKSTSAPTDTRDVVADEKAACLSVDSSKYEIGVHAAFRGHRPVGDRIGHGAQDRPDNARMGFGISPYFRT